MLLVKIGFMNILKLLNYHEEYENVNFKFLSLSPLYLFVWNTCSSLTQKSQKSLDVFFTPQRNNLECIPGWIIRSQYSLLVEIKYSHKLIKISA